MKSFKIYYINLDKSIRRKQFIENQFKRHKISISRFSAIYGKELPKEFLEKRKKEHQILTHFPYLNNGEIGLTKTYFNIWETISIQEEEYAIVLEDDALVTSNFFDDLQDILELVSTNDFIDVSGRKGFLLLNKNKHLSKYLIPALQTTGQIIGKKAAKTMKSNLNKYYAPIDVLKQDVFKHKVNIFTTNKIYVISNDKNIGGTTIQQKKLPKINKVIREIVRPFWQLIALLTYKIYRATKNYLFYLKK